MIISYVDLTSQWPSFVTERNSLEPRREGEGERAPGTHCMRMRLINQWETRGCGRQMSPS